MNRSRHLLLIVALANFVLLTLYAFTAPPRRVEARSASPVLTPARSIIPLNSSHPAVPSGSVASSAKSGVASPDSSRDRRSPAHVPESTAVDLEIGLRGWGYNHTGGSFGYDIDYKNNSSEIANNIVITMTVPPEMGTPNWYGYDSFWSMTNAGNVITWTTVVLYPGESGTLSPYATITNTLANGTVLTSTARISSADTEIQAADNLATFGVPVWTAYRDLYLSISQPSTAAAGEDFNYSLYFDNHGSTDAVNVRITDTLPSGVSLVSSSGGGTPTVTGNQVVWQIGTLYGHSYWSWWYELSVKVHVSESIIPGSQFCHQAEIGTPDPESGTDQNSDSECATIQAPTRDAYITQTLPSLIVGKDSQLYFDYAERGNASLHNVVITETLAPELSIVSTSGPVTPTITGNRLVWSAATLAPNFDTSWHTDKRLYVKVHVADGVAPGINLCSQMEISTSDSETGTSQNSWTACRAVDAQVHDLNLTTEIYEGTPVPGNVVTYRLRYNQTGNSYADGITITDTLPAEMTYDAAHATDDRYGWSRAVSGNQVVWTCTIPDWCWGGGSLYVSGRLSAVPGGTPLWNVAEIGSTSTEIDYTNNRSLHTSASIPAGPDLTVWTTWSNGQPIAGGSLQYGIGYRNNGAGSASNVRIVDTLPPEVTFSTAYYDQNTWTMVRSDNVITWTRSTLAANEYGNMAVYVNIPSGVADGTMVTNTVQILSDSEEEILLDNRASLAMTVYSVERHLSVNLSKNPDYYPVPGTDFKYGLSFYGYGAISTNIVMTVTLPDGVSFVSSSGAVNPTVSENTIVWNVGSYHEDSRYYGLTVHLADWLSAGSSFCAYADISTTDRESDSFPNSTAVCSTVQAPQLDLDAYAYLSDYSSQVNQGSDQTYRISYGSSGNIIAHDVIITFTLPAGVTYVSSSYGYSSPVSTTVVGNNIVWTRPSIAPTYYGWNDASIDLTVHVAEGLPGNTPLTSTVRISSGDAETNYANNSSSYRVTVMNWERDVSAGITVVRGDSYTVDRTAPGDDIPYDISVYNSGTQTSSGIRITSTLPVSTTYVSDSNSSGLTTAITGSTVVWTLPSLAGGARASVRLVARVQDTVSPGARLTNTVQVSTSDPESTLSNNTASYSMLVIHPYEDVTVSTTMWEGSPTPGNNLTYRITYQNLGKSRADGVIVTDTLPVSATFVSSSGIVSPTVTGSRVVWPVGSVAGSDYSSSTAYLYLTVKLADLVSIGTVLTNTVDIGTSSPEVSTANNRGTDSRTVSSGMADLRVTMNFLSPYPVAGETVSYRIVYTNPSTDAALNVSLKDTLPEGMTYVNSAGPVTPLISGSDVTWALGTLPGRSSGSVVISATIASTLPSFTPLFNHAEVWASNEYWTGDNWTNTTDSVQAPARDVSVSVNMSSQAPMDADRTYYVRAVFQGNLVAHNIVVTATLPPGVTLVSTSGPVTPTRSGDLVTWSLGDRLPSYDDLYITVHVPDGLPPGMGLCSRAEISTSDPETSTSANTSGSCMVAMPKIRDLTLYMDQHNSDVKAQPGNILTYQLYYNNTGNSAAANVSIVDTLPAGLTFDSTGDSWGNPLGWTRMITGNQITLTRASLGVGESGYVYVSGRVDDGVSGGVLLTNTAQIGTTDYEADTSDNITSVAVATIESGIDPGVTMSWSGNRAAGKSLTYRIELRNNGTTAAHNVVITDILPAGLIFNSYSGDYDWTFGRTGNVITGTAAYLSAGETKYVDIAVTVDSGIIDGTVLTNGVAISNSDGDDDTSNNTAALPLTIMTAFRDLSTWRSDTPNTVTQGGNATFRLYYGNYGNAPAANVLLTETLPAGASLVSMTGSFPKMLLGNEAVWNLGTLTGPFNGYNPPYVEITIHIGEEVSIGSTLCHTNSIGSSDPESGLYSNTSNRCVSVQAPSQNVSLSYNMWDYWDGWSYVQLRPGTDFDYKISYSIYGSHGAHNVIITDTLPVSTTFVSSRVTVGGYYGSTISVPVTVTGRQVVWDFADLGPNVYGYLFPRVHIDERLMGGQVLTNSAMISTSDWESSYVDNSTSIALTTASPTRDLVATATKNSDIVVVGNTIEYTLRVNNVGSAPAANLVLTNTLPVSMTYVSFSSYGGFTSVITGGTSVWTKPSLSPGSSATLYLTARVDDTVLDGTILTDTLTVSSDDVDGNLADNIARTGVTAQAQTRDLYVNVSQSSSAPSPGSNPTFSISYYNNGNSPAEGTIVTATLPLSTTFVSSSGSITPTISESLVMWNVGSVAAHSFGSMNLIAHVADEVLVGTVLTMTVDIGTSSAETSLADNTSILTQTVSVGAADLSLAKGLRGDTLPRGSVATFAITYTNQTYHNAIGAVLTDTLPAGLTYVTSTGTISPTISGSSVVWPLGIVPGYASNTIYVTVSVASELTNGSNLTNTAVITASNDSSGSNNSASDTHPVTQTVRDLYVGLSAGPSTNSPYYGEHYMIYSVSYGNSGSAPAANVILTETLPVSATFISASWESYISGNSIPFAPTRIVGNRLVWELGSLESTVLNGSARSYQFDVLVYVPATISAESVLTNAVEIGTTDVDRDLTNNAVTNTLAAYKAGIDLIVTKSATGTPGPGSTVDYTISYVNRGWYATGSFSTVLITDVLPAGMTFQSESHSSGWGAQTSSNSVTWGSTNRIYTDEPGTMHVTARIDGNVAPGTVLTNTVTIYMSSGETWPGNNTFELPIVVGNATVDLSLRSALDEDPVAGREITYTLVYGNSGTQPAPNVVLTDTLPTWTSFVTATHFGGLAIPPNSVAGNQLVWNLGTVDSGWSYGIALRVRISDTIPAGMGITNTAQVGTSAWESNYANNTAQLYHINPVPAITSIDPITRPVGAAAFALTVTGNNFNTASVVRWNGVSRATTYTGPTLVTAAIPESDLTGVAAATVTVFNPRPGGGESNSVTLGLNKTSTLVALASTGNPSVLGQPVSFTATVTSVAPSVRVPTGTVRFQLDGVDWLTATLSGGIATTSPTTTLALGSHALTASYSGDDQSIASSGSLTGGQLVERALTRVIASSSGLDSPLGGAVTFTGTVSVLAPGTAALTGTVQFQDYGTAFTPALDLSGGTTAFTTTNLAAGAHVITVDYSGSPYLQPSTSAAITHRVATTSTVLTLASGAPNPSVYGQPVILTATVSSGAGIPTGAVSFWRNAITLGTGTMNANGVATTTVDSLVVGTHTITATYSGGGSYAPSTSAAITQTVVKAASAITIAGTSRNPSVVGEQVIVTFTVAAAPPGAGTATGDITVTNGASLCTATLPTTSCSLVLARAGANNLTASYGGNTRLNANTSAAFVQNVDRADVSVTLSSSATAVPYADPVVLTATVSAAPPGAGAPSGTVSFKDGTITLGSGTLSDGKATFTTAALAMGSHSITAVYEGDTAFNSGASSALNQMIGKARSATVMASSANPAAFGQGISFTATVTSAVAGAGTPTGNVQFRIDSVDWGTPAALVNGRAVTPVTSTLSVGNHTLTAAYSGDDGFEASSGTLAGGQVITKANTATTITGNKLASALGESVIFTATVSVLLPGAGTPTGSIQFRDDATILGNAILSESTATLSTTALSGGSHAITAVYAGDDRYAGSTATGITQTVSRANPNIRLMVAPSSSVFGQPVSFTTTVTSTLGIPGGTVTLKEGATALVTTTLSPDSVAVSTISSLGVGTHTITATYNGDNSFNSIASASISQSVGKANTTTTLTSAPTTPVFGQTVIFTATVTTVAPGAGTPTGSVTFNDEANTLGTGMLNVSGVATLITNTLPVTTSPHSISAVYGGDANMNASPAVTMSQTVTRANVTVLVTSSKNPSLTIQPVVFTATVSATSPGAGTPGGTVLFKIDATDWITATLVNGKASAPVTSTLRAGNHAIAVVYNGDENFNPGIGTLTGGQTVNKLSTTTAVQSSPNPSVWGQPVTLTATVSSDGATPSGMVGFKEGVNLLGTGELSNGVATLVTSTLAVGTHAITAEYTGNGIFNSSSGALTGGQRVKGTTLTTIKAHTPNPSNEGAPVTVAFSLTVTSPGGGTPSGNVSVSGGGAITCTASIASGSCAVVFANPGSKALTATYAGDGNFVGSASSVSHTVTNLVPTITSISHPSSRAGSPGFTLTVTGTNFIEGSVVRWNGSPRTTTFVSSTQLKATILASDLTTPGTAKVTVAHPAPAGDVSNAVTHTIVASNSRVYVPLLVR